MLKNVLKTLIKKHCVIFFLKIKLTSALKIKSLVKNLKMKTLLNFTLKKMFFNISID